MSTCNGKIRCSSEDGMSHIGRSGRMQRGVDVALDAAG